MRRSNRSLPITQRVAAPFLDTRNVFSAGTYRFGGNDGSDERFQKYYEGISPSFFLEAVKQFYQV